MKNRKELSIIFYRDDDCGIAKIVVYNTTNNTYVNEDNQETSTYSYILFDTYVPTGYAEEEKPCAFTVSLEDGCEYIVSVEHSGTYNVSSSSPYYINVLRYMSSEKYVETGISAIMRLWHSDFPLDSYDFVADQTDQQEIEIISLFSGNGVTRKFWVNGTNHASEFVRFSVDGGINWLLPNNLNLTWGSNTDCDDNLFDSDGYGAVNFDIPPPAGSNNVVVVWRPLVNKFKLIQTINQPKSAAGDVTDYNSNPELLDYAIELIP